MYINFSYKREFEHLLLDLKDKYNIQFFDISGISDDYLDITKYSQNYFNKKHSADTTMDKNANVRANHIGIYNAERFKGHSKLNSLFLIWDQLRKDEGTKEANRLIEEEFIKSINIQDSHGTYLPYCFNFATLDLIDKGLPFIASVQSLPPKHADAFIQQTIQLCMFAASDQLLGATSIGDFLIVYSYLLQKDSLNSKYFTPNYIENPEMFELYVKQELQKFIYTINQPVRKNQSIFTNITLFDSIFLKELQKLYFFDNQASTFDLEFTMKIQKLFLKYFTDFNKDQIFTFPVLTAQFKIDENNEIEDKEFLDYISEINCEFANINIFSSQNLNGLSSCCRLQSNVESIINNIKNENMNLIGGSTLKVGSFGVTSINLPRIACDYKGNKEGFFKCLQEKIKDCIKINNARRKLIEKNIDRNQLPLYTHNFIKLDNQYSTVGYAGFYECIDLFGLDILTDEGKQFGLEINNCFTTIINEKIKKLGYKINCEQIPGESTCVNFAYADILLKKQNKYNIYSNQYIPLINEADIIDRIELQALFEKANSGGSILHLNVGEKIKSKNIMKQIIEYTIKKGVSYFAINYYFIICKNKHFNISHNDICPTCGEDIIEKFTRIVGFIVPISSWQKERREEGKKRKFYKNEIINNI